MTALNKQVEIIVGMGSCGVASGADKIYRFFKEEIAAKNLPVKLSITGCIGMCYREPLVEINPVNGPLIMYQEVTIDKAREILEGHILNGKPLFEYQVNLNYEKKEGVLAKQVRIALRNCGLINPESIEDYRQMQGYDALQQVLSHMTRQEVIDAIKTSGLKGRGGAGFSTGMKWQFGHDAEGDKKYIVCNGDEGDPGAFMDRSLLESDPHSVIEGLLIGAYAVGAKEGFVYVRSEYPMAIKRVEHALKEAEAKGFIGSNICNTDFSCKLKIKEGAGAFVCGEETALMQSIEGKRGMPRKRPPFPTQSGLWECPTVINNVETLSNIAWIILNGPKSYAALGTAKSKGTKVFALAGDIVRGGLIEVPMGISLKEIIYDIGGGIPNGRTLKAIQMGGPSGGCIPARLIDTVLDYEEIINTGAIMGSGGLIVMDDRSCMVDVAKFFLKFTQRESCGKCTFCRVGTKRMLEILSRISDSSATMSDLDLLEELAEQVRQNSLCGLGQSAPNPVLTTLRYFRDEYITHIKDKRCPARKCQDLLRYHIVADKCVGCTACARVCPVNAIFGERKKTHVIDEGKCIACGNCDEACKFDAVRVE